MLDIKKISHNAVYDEAWRKARLGKFCASQIGKIMSSKSHEGKFTEGAITYIENLAGEIITGKPMRAEFFTDATNHGNATEPEAIKRFCEVTHRSVLRNEDQNDTHRLIVNDDYSCATPDALLAMAEEKFLFDETGTKIKVAPLEVKCPLIHNRFIKLFKCITPQDLKKTEPLYYYQCLAQLIFCDSLIGFFAGYNFDFTTNMRIIEFKKMELRDEIKNFNLSLSYAKKELVKILEMFPK